MADVNNAQSFSRFPQLPKEIRLMIWEMALPGPRVVNVEMKPLETTYLEWEQEKDVGDETTENTSDSKATENVSDSETYLEEEQEEDVGNETTENASDGEATENTSDSETSEDTSDSETIPVHCCERLGTDCARLGVKSNAPPPAMLLACRESFAVARKFYERVFSINPSHPETYFDFDRDTLYIRHDTFGWYSLNPEAITDHLIYFNIHNGEDMNRVKNLALRLDPESTVSVEECLVSVLVFFQGLERLSLVVQHYCQDDIASPLCLIEPINVDAAWLDSQLFVLDPDKLDEMPEISSNDIIEFEDIDREAIRDALEPQMGEDYILPQIEYRVIVTQSFKEHLDSVRARGLGDSR